LRTAVGGAAAVGQLLSVGSGVFEDLGEGFEREHVQVQEVARLLVDGFLEPLLGRRVGGEIADASCGDVVLGEGVDEAFPDFGCLC